VSIPYIPIPIFSQPRRQKDAIESNNKTAQCTKQSPTTIKASEGRRFIVTRYTAGVPGIPPTNAGRLEDADWSQQRPPLSVPSNCPSQSRH